MTELLKDIEGVVAYMDDILVFAETAELHEERLQNTLDTLRKAGLKLNHDKCLLRQRRLSYLGHCIDEHGIQPDESKVQAITQLQPPNNVHELRRILGMIHYLGRYLPHLSDITKPLTDLLKTEVIWGWGTAQQEAFKRVKQLVTEAPVLAFYDVKRDTVVSADASSYGLGAVLLQSHDGHLKPVAYCSRTMTDTEKRYAQIEKECLAAVWACEKFSKYLYGLDTFTLQSDHKPLIPLINSKDIDSVPMRCQRLLLRMLRYNPTAEYVPGKQLVIADTLSRHPQLEMTRDVAELTSELEAYEEAVRDEWPVSPSKLDMIRQNTLKDDELRSVEHYVLGGWPQYSSEVPLKVKAFYSHRDQLTVSQGLVLYNNRIVIPKSMRMEILERIHDGHQGIVKCRERAQCSVWWPGISKNIQERVSTCNVCQEIKPTQKREPLLCTPLPSRPWEKVAADICHFNNKNFLVVVDYFSRYIEIAHLNNMSTETTIASLKNIFARWGCPVELITDNGPQFTGTVFAHFAKAFDFRHTTTSPHYAQANGEAERAVQTAKWILRQADPALALLSYRATPLQATGASPSQLMLGRQIRSTLPTLEANLQPAWPDFQKVRQQDDLAKLRYSHAYDSRYKARPLPELQPGTRVLVKLDNERGWTKSASVVRKHHTPRSYIVQTENGELRRNRHHLRPILPATTALQQKQVPVGPSAQNEESDSQIDRPATPDTGSPVPPASSTPVFPETLRRSERAVKPPDRYGDYV